AAVGGVDLAAQSSSPVKGSAPDVGEGIDPERVAEVSEVDPDRKRLHSHAPDRDRSDGAHERATLGLRAQTLERFASGRDERSAPSGFSLVVAALALRLALCGGMDRERLTRHERVWFACAPPRVSGRARASRAAPWPSPTVSLARAGPRRA